MSIDRPFHSFCRFSPLSSLHPSLPLFLSFQKIDLNVDGILQRDEAVEFFGILFDYISKRNRKGKAKVIDLPRSRYEAIMGWFKSFDVDGNGEVFLPSTLLLPSFFSVLPFTFPLFSLSFLSLSIFASFPFLQSQLSFLTFSPSLLLFISPSHSFPTPSHSSSSPSPQLTKRELHVGLQKLGIKVPFVPTAQTLKTSPEKPQPLSTTSPSSVPEPPPPQEPNLRTSITMVRNPRRT